ncbi:MAG: flagellar biosynthesis protein FlhG, partial [Candidatus Azotimanducaceae bacterium]
PSAMALRQIAKKALQWPIPQTMEGHLEFFIERLINYSTQESRL